MKKIVVSLYVVCLSLLAFSFTIKLEEKKKNSNKQECVVGVNVGNKAPELKFKSPEGKEYALSSVNKGKIVLIDFWASWCGPCRMENPAVVAAYQKYKDAKFKNAKGFTIYSVSLDKSQDAWVNAIKKDNLTWDYHVSDLGHWNSQAAQIYGVNSIPANYLLDADGVIIAKNLRGAALEEAIKKLMIN